MDLARGDDPLVAWRGWRFDPERRQLKSLVQRGDWPRFRRMEAAAPTYGGLLGLHAWARRDQLDEIIRLDTRTIPVWGQVSLWGTIIEHECGYRAQFAYPYSLLILKADRSRANSLSGAYGVEVTTI